MEVTHTYMFVFERWWHTWEEVKWKRLPHKSRMRRALLNIRRGHETDPGIPWKKLKDAEKMTQRLTRNRNYNHEHAEMLKQQMQKDLDFEAKNN